MLLSANLLCAFPVVGIRSKHSPKHERLCMCVTVLICVCVCVCVIGLLERQLRIESWMERASLWWLPSSGLTLPRVAFCTTKCREDADVTGRKERGEKKKEGEGREAVDDSLRRGNENKNVTWLKEKKALYLAVLQIGEAFDVGTLLATAASTIPPRRKKVCQCVWGKKKPRLHTHISTLRLGCHVYRC